MTVAATSVRKRFMHRLKVTRGARVAAGLAVVTLAAGSFAGCTTAQLQGQSSSYLIIENIECANGAEPDKLASTCASDVQTYVKRQVNGQQVLVPTVFEDPGKVTFRLGLKNPGSAETPTKPTTANYITVNRYRVTFVRADGRNTPGIDVPYPFDGAFTATVGADVVSATLSLVRVQAKLENPLLPLIGNGGALAIGTLAEITFFGQDQSGREVTVTGRIGVNFSDWGDPE